MNFRMTYKQLAEEILKLDREQQNSDLTVEILDENCAECFAAELRICNENHESLDDGHPVIFLDFKDTSKRFDSSKFNINAENPQKNFNNT